MPFELFVSLRFLREGRAQTWLIFIGVGVGVGVMVFLSALITGLQASLIRQTLSTQPHVVVKPRERTPRLDPAPQNTVVGVRVEKGAQRVARIDDWVQARDVIARVEGVTRVAPTVAGSAFAHRGPLSASIALRGIDPNSYDKIVDLRAKLTAGRLELIGSDAVIGVELARDLGLEVGDRVRLQTTSDREDIVRVAGVFDLGNKDINQRWVFVSIREAQSLLDLAGSVSSFEVRVSEPFDADRIAEVLVKRTGYIAEPWTQLNRQLLVALKSQSSSSIMIQFFVVLAVALGIASVLVVSVVQKSREIGILRATGTSVRSITWIFMIQGLIVGSFGSIIGSALGTVLALSFAQMAVNPDGSPTFPVTLDAALFTRAVLVAVLVGLAAAVAPARRAARLDPAVAIRHV
ncbi:MAG TPA: FtsX-like permease family protein [Polyangiaceae bacterium]|nr:FtsX-like permease family protein [Polyangiaceae bacterium]